MNNKTVGTVIIGIAALMGFMIFLFNKALTDIVGDSCSDGIECPMWGAIDFQTNLSLGLMVFVIAIGFYLIFFTKEKKHIETTLVTKPTKEDYREKMTDLDEDERHILEKVIDSNGAAFQSALVDEEKFTKVKVTRILDKLEGRGLIERKRRGMTNIVILKKHN